MFTWPFARKKDRAREAYAEALEAARKAWKRGDTRTIHTAQRALVEAQTERLRAGV
jgi:hypothetical protein